MPAKKKVAKKAATKSAKKAPTKKVAAKAAKKAPAKKVAEEIPVVVIKKDRQKPEKPVVLTAFMKKQQKKLLELRDQLVIAMEGQKQTAMEIAKDSDTSGSGEHTGDAGTDAYDRDFALSQLSKEHDSLEEIEKALERIDFGVYGVCEISGEKIPQMRLEVIPFARLTIECQSNWEKENGNQRFKPTETVGYTSW